MDSITQAALGGAIGELLLGKKAGWRGALAGAIVATIPDLDVVLIPFCNDLQKITIHRGYSHSILFSFVGAFIVAYVLSNFKWAEQVSKVRLWWFSWLALFTHILLDAFTTFGTQLFLPFSDYRVGFDSINIVDPVYTVPLLVGLLLSLFSKHPHKHWFNKVGLIISTFYLMGTLGIKSYVNGQFESALREQNIVHHDLLTVPVAIGSIHWYGVAKTTDGVYLGKYSNWTRNEIHFEYFPINDHLLNSLDPWLVNRLKWFSKGFYTVTEAEGKIRLYSLQVDMRGIRQIGNYKAPTAGYFEITPQPDGGYALKYRAHEEEE